MGELAELCMQGGEPPELERAMFRAEFSSSFESGRIAIENALVVLRAYG